MMNTDEHDVDARMNKDEPVVDGKMRDDEDDTEENTELDGDLSLCELGTLTIPADSIKEKINSVPFLSNFIIQKKTCKL